MSEIVVVPATADRWPELLDIFGGDGSLGCWCQYWRPSAAATSTVGSGSRQEWLLEELETGPPAPGVIALLDGEPAGWCRVGPRSSLLRLVRSRTIPALDDMAVWSIVCFKVRVGYRRRGVARALLDGAIAHARAAGAPAVEGYPIDAAGDRLDVGFSYVGFTSTFEAAGFRRAVETAGHSAGRPRWLMRLDLLR